MNKKLFLTKTINYLSNNNKNIKIVYIPALYTIVCLLGIFIAFYPTILSRFALMQSDPGDTRLNNYFLEHSFQLLINKEYVGDLWSPAFFYPYENVLAFSENLFGSAPIYWLFRLFVSADLAFQIWMIAVSILGFASFVFLMRRYQVSHLLSAFGALLFAFSMPRINQIGHQQLLPQFFTPLAFFIGWEFFLQPTRKKITLFLLLTYLQVLAGIYLGWFLLFSLPIFFAIAYKLAPPSIRSNLLSYCRVDYKAIITITLVWAATMFLTLLPYLEAKSVLGKRPYSEVDTMLPRISSWFAVDSGSLWAPLLSSVSKSLPMPVEHRMFAGVIILFLIGVSVYTLFNSQNILTLERALVAKVCFFVFITLFILSLRLPFGISLWRIIYEVVPGASVIRAVTRIWLIAYFYLLIAGILCFDSLLQSTVFINRSILKLVIVSICCLIGISEQFIFNLPNYEKAPLLKETTEISSLMKQGCSVAYLSLNLEKPFFTDQLTAMWAGIEANIPVVNGYSSAPPPNYGDMGEPLKISQVLNWLSFFSKDISGNLCVISQKSKSLEKKDNFFAPLALQKNAILSSNFIFYAIKLPIEKIFRQEITLFEYPKIMRINLPVKIPIVVKNTSNFLWSIKGDKPTNLSYKWIGIDSQGKLTNIEGNRTQLPFDIAPGESAAINAVIKPPALPGKYTLILTMVQETVAWFSDKQSPYPKIDVTVTSNS
ncbi:COG1470 family protein [Nostoc sp.]|uniref:COG1470 family protein n=1 Tax=Nostoc sp. TaxID=1180 RepID=UPI002FFB13D9